ncbi:hypothetical protein CUMW_191560 [Citrus unshiu]|uniref:FBD domain-containing protein n=1 Tax=Citrus unshiu TaxID=55188 RepID=A0A2H5Q384_CITUN|nr:hypothetical protein CUMW_191560 [Citrus unshiu]
MGRRYAPMRCVKRGNDDMDDTSVILINKKRRRHNLDEDLTSLLLIMKEVKENGILIGLVPEAVPYNIPQPYSVKHLDSAVEDDDCLLSCAAFFKASPSFYKFIFSVEPSSGSARSVKDHPYVSFTDLRIRVVELNGFERLIADVESLICLIENAKLLEKITVDTSKRWAEAAITVEGYMEEAQCIDALDQLNNSSITCQLPDSTMGFITHSLCKVK